MHVTFIGDIHGCYKSMLALLEKIPQEDNRLIFMGDLINKGPSSYEVYQFIRENEHECLKGNHEYYCIFRDKKPYKELWKHHGGIQTEASCNRYLNLNSSEKTNYVLDDMSTFFGTLPEYIIINTAFKRRILATHGGISHSYYRQSKYHLNKCLEAESIAAKPYFFNKEPLAVIPEVMQVIGHQPTAYAPIKTNENYLIDSGCVYDGRRGMGYLSALTFDLNDSTEPIFFRQPNIDL